MGVMMQRRCAHSGGERKTEGRGVEVGRLSMRAQVFCNSQHDKADKNVPKSGTVENLFAKM